MKARFHPARPARVVTLAVGALLMLGVPSALAQRPGHDQSRRSPLAKVPGNAVAKRNPLAGDADAVRAGQKLFEMHCAECHATGARGRRRGPNLRAKEVQQAKPGALFWILSNGVVRRGMPDWSKLPEPERWQIVTYLQSLDSPAGQPASEASVKHPPTARAEGAADLRRPVPARE